MRVRQDENARRSREDSALGTPGTEGCLWVGAGTRFNTKATHSLNVSRTACLPDAFRYIYSVHILLSGRGTEQRASLKCRPASQLPSPATNLAAYTRLSPRHFLSPFCCIDILLTVHLVSDTTASSGDEQLGHDAGPNDSASTQASTTQSTQRPLSHVLQCNGAQEVSTVWQEEHSILLNASMAVCSRSLACAVKWHISLYEFEEQVRLGIVVQDIMREVQDNDLYI